MKVNAADDRRFRINEIELKKMSYLISTTHTHCDGKNSIVLPLFKEVATNITK